MNIEKGLLERKEFEPTRKWLEGKYKDSDFSAWCTHQPILIQMIQLTTGNILELGMGDFSTPIINQLKGDRMAVSLETNAEWYSKFKHFDCNDHRIILQTEYDKFNWNCSHLNIKWGLALVDNAPGESRASNILKLKDNADIILVHDSQEAGYKYEPVFKLFKFRNRFSDFSTTTEILSNTVDINSLNLYNYPTL